jgi:hypothetical protein
MPDQQSIWLVASGLFSSIWPGLVGALIAMYSERDTARPADLVFTGLSRILLSAIFGPALCVVFKIETPAPQAAVSALVAIFGLNIIGEAVKAIREVGLAEFFRGLLRRIVGTRGDGK